MPNKFKANTDKAREGSLSLIVLSFWSDLMAYVCFYGISLKWNYAADIGNFQTLLFLQRDMEMNPLWLIILSRLYEILHRKPCSLWAFIWKFRYSELNFCILKWCQVPLCASDETYFPGRCADIVCRGEVIGKLGVIHPEVLSNFDLTLPAAALELNFEALLWFICISKSLCHVATFVETSGNVL